MYIIVGGMTTAVNFLVFYLLYSMLGIDGNISNILSVVTAVFFAYAANKIFVFKSKTENLNMLLCESFLFFSARSITLFLEVAGVFLATSLLGSDPGHAKVAINVIVLILNYIFSALIFTDKENAKINKWQSFKFVIQDKINFILFLTCNLIFFSLCFIPILSCWYYGDDIYSRNIRELMQYYNLSFLQYNINYFKYIIVEVGRFLPVHLINRNIVFYVFHNINAYRFYIFISNYIAINLFAYMVWIFSRSRGLSFAISILYPAMFFFLSPYDDPITSYFMFLQTLTIYFSLALIFTKYYIDTEKKRYIFFSLVLYTLALLTYEVSYPLGILFLFVFYFYKEGSARERTIYALKSIVPFAAALVFNFSIYVYYSSGASIHYGGSAINLNVRSVFITTVKQIIAALPVIPSVYSLYDKQFNMSDFINNVTYIDMLTVLMLIIIILGYVFIQRYRLKKNGENTTGSNRITSNQIIFLCLLSFVLITFPSVVIGVTSKYQNELKIGLGYLPTYLSRFGVLIICYLVYIAIIKLLLRNAMLKNIFRCLTLSIICFSLLFSLQVNRKVLERKNFYVPSRLFIENSIRQNLFEHLPDKSSVLVYRTWADLDSDENLSGIFSDFSSKRIKLFTYKNNNEKKALEENRLFYFDHVMFDSDDGYAFVGEMTSLELNVDDRPELLKNIKLYYKGSKYTHINIEIVNDSQMRKVIKTPLIKKDDLFYEIFIPYNCVMDTLKFI